MKTLNCQYTYETGMYIIKCTFVNTLFDIHISYIIFELVVQKRADIQCFIHQSKSAQMALLDDMADF